MNFRLCVDAVNLTRSLGAGLVLSLLMVASASANKSCDATAHINELRKAGWFVVDEDLDCAVSLVAKLAKIVSSNGYSSGIGQVLVRESAGPICVSLAWQQIKQGCVNPGDLRQATLQAKPVLKAEPDLQGKHNLDG